MIIRTLITLALAVPIMIQNGITNFVNMLDNIMVGRIGTEPMSGVAIVNQILFIFNLVIFGSLAGSGIFTAQAPVLLTNSQPASYQEVAGCLFA